MDDEFEYYVDNINDAILFFFAEYNSLFRIYFTQSPDFRAKGIHFYDGSIVLSDGILKSGPAVLKVSDNKLLLKGSIRVDSADVSYSFWSIFRLGADITGAKVQLELEVTRNGNNCSALLTDNTHVHLKDVAVSVSNPLSFVLHWIVELIKLIFGISAITDYANDFIKDFLNKPEYFYCNKLFRAS